MTPSASLPASRTIELALGIDAGGTYTDAVILNQATGAIVASCKSPTTRPDASFGIQKALEGLDLTLLTRIQMVSLATTFATNAIVEDIGARAGLILIGYDDNIAKNFQTFAPVMELRGGHTVAGFEKEPLDLAFFQRNLESFAQDLEAIAIAGFFSIRNPEHENRLAQEIRTRLDLPVVCSHQLSMRLNAIKRATTALWNARLIPLVTMLIKSCQEVLAVHGLKAPFMVIRGDGTLMSANSALERPIDTLLSGPAASILGAKHLSGVNNGLIVDMGGTTTDMAILTNGRVETDPTGARIGKWETHVEAAKIRTLGLGGDSYINLNQSREIVIGPRRVIPLCRMAEQEPRLLEYLYKIHNQMKGDFTSRANPCSFYFNQNPVDKKSGIISEFLLWQDQDEWRSLNKIIEEEKNGAYSHSALSPTDIWVAAGKFEFGCREAALLGRKIMSVQLNVSEDEFTALVDNCLSQTLCTEAVAFSAPNDCESLFKLLPLWYPPKKRANNSGFALELNLRCNSKTIVVGAPAPCVKHSFDHLSSASVSPKGYEVAVAVGAVVGMVDMTFTALIRKNTSRTYDLFTSQKKESFANLGQAKLAGRERLEEIARSEMRKNNVSDPFLEFQEEDQTLFLVGEDSYLQTTLKLRSTGRPAVC